LVGARERKWAAVDMGADRKIRTRMHASACVRMLTRTESADLTREKQITTGVYNAARVDRAHEVRLAQAQSHAQG
jgi:hypothetical protein